MWRVGQWFSRLSFHLTSTNEPTLARESDQQCHRAVAHIVTGIDLRSITTAQQLCDAYARLRNRPIEFRCIDMPARIFGLCARDAEADWICVAAGLLVPHQEHIVCHEILHLEMGHTLQEVDSMLSMLFPHFNLDFARSALQRSCADSAQERETEFGGSLLKQAWYSMRAVDVAQSAPADPTLQRVQSDLDQFMTRLNKNTPE